METRKINGITWSWSRWIQRDEGFAELEGEDWLGNEYLANGRYLSNGELEEVEEIRKVESDEEYSDQMADHFGWPI